MIDFARKPARQQAVPLTLPSSEAAAAARQHIVDGVDTATGEVLEPKLYSNADGAYRCTDGLQGVWKVDVREERRTGFSAQPGTFPLCPITAPKHGSSAVEILKFKGLAVASLHFYNMGHEMRSTLKTAYGVIGVQ